jgi:hypothetical protein
MPLRLSVPLSGPFSYSTTIRLRKRRRRVKRKGIVLVGPLILPFRASTKSARKAQQNTRDLRTAYQARRAGR